MLRVLLLVLVAACDADIPTPTAPPLQPSVPEAAPAPPAAVTEADVIGVSVPAIQARTWYTRAADPNAEATVVVFWEVWCPHCRSELPSLQARADAWAERGVDVVALTRLTNHTSPDEARGYVAREGLTYAVGEAADDGLAERLAVRGIPAAAIVRGGVVRWRGHPARIDEALIDRVLADEPALESRLAERSARRP